MLMLRTLLAFLITGFAAAQTLCTQPARSDTAHRLHAAQHRALAFESMPMDSGVPPAAAPLLLELKAALATATDTVVACTPTSVSPTTIEASLTRTLHDAAPGIPEPDLNKLPDDKPLQGVFGNDVHAHVQLFPGPPQLLAVTLESTVSCGTDSQLLIYQQYNGRWTRALRWSADLKPSQASDIGFPWGDFFNVRILTDPQQPASWRAVVVHGTPWCTSRMSSFGMAIVGPSPNGNGASVVWQSNRGYSRFEFDPHLTSTANTFEFRVHADEMEFNDVGFERLVIYRYRVQGNTVTRLQPIAANARGFVEEWLSMPWTEAANQSAPGPDVDALHRIHTFYGQSPAAESDNYTSWAAGPVRACSTPEHFQVAFDSETKHIVPGKPGGTTDNLHHHYFQLQHIPTGYRLLSISPSPDSTCTGPDLMREHSH